jgi:hypothetical protein
LRRVHENPHVAEVAKGLVDQRPDVAPVKASVPAPQGRHGDGADAVVGDHLPQVREASPNVIQSRVGAPVPLGREIDQVPRLLGAVGLIDEHRAEPDFASLACRLVGAEVARVGLLELQDETLAHDADGVDRID